MWELNHKEGWAPNNWCFTFKLWCWRRLFRVPWTARRSNQSIWKEINPEYSLEGLLQKPKLQYLGHMIQRVTHWKRLWCWGRLNAGREGDDRGWNGWITPKTQWIWVWVNQGDGKGKGRLSSVQSWSRVQLFVTPWTGEHQASLFITNSHSLLKLISIESVMPSNHLILCCPPLLPPSIFLSIRVFSNESGLHIR